MHDEPELALDAFDAEPPTEPHDRRRWLLERLGTLVEHLGEPLVRVTPDLQVTDRTPLRFTTFSQASGEELWALLDDHGRLHLGRIGFTDTVVSHLAGFNRKYNQVISLVASRHDRRASQITDVWIVLRRWTPELGHAPAFNGAPARVTELIGYHAEVVVGVDGITVHHAREGGGQAAQPNYLHPLALDEGTLPLIIEGRNAVAGFGDDLFRPEAEALELGRLPKTSSFVVWTPGVTLTTRPELALVIEGLDSDGDIKIDRPAPVRAAALRSHRVGGTPTRGKPPGRITGLDCFVADDRELTAYAWRDETKSMEAHWRQPLGAPARGVALAARDGAPADVDVLVALRNGKVRHYRPIGTLLEREWQKTWTQLEAVERISGPGACFDWLEARLDDDGDTTGLEACLAEPQVRQALLRRAVEVALHAATAHGGAGSLTGRCARLIAREDPSRDEWPSVDFLSRALEDRPDSDARAVATLVRQTFEAGASLPCRQRLCLAIRRAAATGAEDRPGAADIRWLAREAAHNAFDDWDRVGSDDRSRLHRCGVGFGRWGNRFLLSDKFAGAERGVEHLQHVTCLRAGGSLWTAVVRRTCVTFRLLGDDGKVDVALQEQEEPAGIRHVATLRAPEETGGDLLLIVTDDHHLRICRVESARAPMWRCTREGSWPADDSSGHERAILSALDALQVEDGWIVLGGFGREGNSRVSMVKIALDGSCRRLGELRPDCRGLITALHLARTASTGGFRLLVGGSRDSHAELWELDEALRPRNTAPFRRDVDRRVMAVRFSGHDEPAMVALGDRSGFIWGIDLTIASSGLEALERLKWTNRLQGSVATIKSVYVDGRWCFLVSSDTGRVVLLDLDGRRLWKERFTAPIVGMATAEVPQGQLIVVALRSGAVHVYRYLTDRERQDSCAEALQLLDQPALQQWVRDQKVPPHRADLQVAWAVGQLQLRLSAPATLLKSLRFRAARAQFVRYLTEQAGTLREAQRDAVVAAMNYRDLALLQSYARRDDHRWGAAIDKRLLAVADDISPRDSGIGARAHAQALRLLRLGWNAPTDSVVMQRRPPDADLRVRWVRLELARLIGVAVSRTHPKDFPVTVLQLLADLPPPMVDACSTAFGQVFTHGPLFAALTRMVEGLYGTDLQREDAVLVASSLAPYRHHPVADLLWTLVSLMALAPVSADSWPEHRKVALDCVRHLGRWLGQPPLASEALRDLLAELRRRMPGDLAMPADQRPLAERARWARRAVDALPRAASRAGDRVPECPWTWPPLNVAIVAKTRAIVRRLLDLEREYCERHTRAAVTFDEIRTFDRDELGIVLIIDGEGPETLSDVRVTIDASGEDGLLRTGQGALVQTFTYSSFPSEPLHVSLRGATRPGQPRFSVRVRLESANGTILHEEVWSSTIESGPSSLLSFRRYLPKAFAARCAKWFGGSGMLVVSLDDDLGPSAFVDAASEKHGARIVSLDDQFSDVGRGKTYQSLTPQEVVGKLRHESGRAGGGDPRTLTVAYPATAFFDALCENGERQTLGAVLRALQAEWSRRRSNTLVIFVSSLHAAHVRAEAPDVRIESGHRLSGPDEMHEGGRWIAQVAGASERQAAETIETLGGDLRFLAEWLTHVVAASRHERDALGRTLTHLLRSPDVQQRLCADLQGLDPVSLLAVMAGAVCETRLQLSDVVPGLYAAEHIHSHPTKGAPKRVQAAGGLVTVDTLQDIRADSSPSRPQSLWVQGVGRLSAIRSVAGSRAAEIAGRLGVNYGTISRDFGHLVDEVFRTAEPYRGMLLRFYQELALAKTADQNGHDDRIFRRIRGDGVSVTELFTVEQLATLPDEMLEDLSPTSNKSDRQLLRRLGLLWHGTSKDHRPTLALAFGKPKLAPLADLATTVNFGTLPKQDGVQMFVSDSAAGDEFVCWLQEPVLMSTLRTALDTATRSVEAPEPATPKTLRLLAVGPGTRELQDDSERIIAVITDARVRLAASTGGVSAKLQEDVRAQWRHSVMSPYHTIGGLPANSPLFFGRDEELQSVGAGFQERSVLIVGSRRIGKTSLLNRLHAWADREPGLVAIYLDIAELPEGKDVLARLRAWIDDNRTLIDQEPAGAGDLLDTVIHSVRASGRTPLFLLNEADKLLYGDRAFVSRLRSLHETGQARFVFVGYASALQELKNPNSPLYNFTEGIRPGERAITLRELDEVAATRLIDLLETRVGLTWWNEKEKREGVRLLLDHSYRIPWFLQTLCHAVCEHLDDKRESRIRRQHIEAVIKQEASTLWSELEKVDYGRLLQSDGVTRDQAAHNGPAGVRRSDELLSAAIPMVITAVARKLYFQARPGLLRPIDDPRLQQRSPLEPSLSFTVGEAREIVTQTLGELLLTHERVRIQPWLARMPLADIFGALTLTLILEPDPNTAERFGFFLHLYPRELRRHYEADVRLDTVFTDRAREFWSRFQQQSDAL